MIKKKYKYKVRFGTCSKDCYGSCVFTGVWDDDAQECKFISAIPSKSHPFTNGFFCPKYKRREDLIYHPERLKNALIRTGPKPENNFKKISLNKALELITEKLINNQSNNNFNSVLGSFYTGNSGLISQYAPLRFFRKIGATITNGGICNEGGCAGLTELFGTYSTTNPFQLNNQSTKLIVIWGSNLSESNNHAYYLIKQALKNGVKLVVIDSRRTVIAEKANNFLQILPGTEHLLVKLIVSELINYNAHDKDFLTKYVESFSSVFLEVTRIDKSKLLKQIGIDYYNIQNFVKLLIRFKHHTIFNIGYGVQKDYFGGKIVKTIALIQILLGNIGKIGTGLIYSQSNFIKPLIKPLLNYITNFKKDSKIKEISLVKLGSFLLSKNYKLLFIYNFNPASSLPNQNLLRKALLRENLYVIVLDMFLNETTKYADIVIPVKFDLESYDIISPYYIPSLSINIGGPCPYSDCMSNFEFFQQLAWKLGFKESLSFQESEKIIFRNCLKMLPLKIQEALSTKGYYLLFDKDFVPFNNLEFPTLNNRIQAGGSHFEFGENQIDRKLNRKKNEFILISPSHFYFLHSQLGQLNNRYLEDFNKIFLTTTDIKNLGLTTGEDVLVANEYGTGVYKLAESSMLKSGTALIYSGLSSTLKGTPNVNFFTPDKPEKLGFSGAYNSAIIQVNKII